MGEDLLYSRLFPRGKGYYIANFPGEKATMGEKLLYNTGFMIKIPLRGSILNGLGSKFNTSGLNIQR
jgi:hypothetical protein